MEPIHEESLQLVGRRIASSLLDCSIETLKRREKSGILRPLKMGSRVKYRRADLEQLLREAEVTLK